LFVDGYHYDEIADSMGIPMGTVKSRIFHARKKLSEELAHFA
jgi:RNA polymerase sigma-70 factor (ECF subfamily)